MAKRRKVGNLLALAVLSTLAERAMHPYELASVLRERGKDQSIKINWGSLYTVVQNLEKHGFIEAAGTSRQGRHPERTIYSITDAGRAELADWLRELVSVPEREYPRFEAALSVLGILPPDEAIPLLRRRLEALDADVAQQRAALAEYGKQISRMFLIEAEYHLALTSAEANWLRDVLAELDSGAFPDLHLWYAFHGKEVPPS
jgi:DNA-binding PadR family transcriptional regulator